ncbi:MAG: hypothetical protein CMH31_01550 [Micavibrio sp.]|nr:hypothetical protein [Micavibrio sp.]
MKRLQNISFKTFFYRAYLVLLALLSLYAIVGIAHFKWLYISIDEPKAEFLIKPATVPSAKQVTIIEFLDYSCQYCKEVNPNVEELLRIRKDIRYIVRPVAFDEEISEPILRHVLAAGLQGKFWEMHKAVLEYPENTVSQDFFKETAELYGLDIEKFLSDAQSKQVEKIIDDNLNAVFHAGIPSTPSFLVGNKIYVPSDSIPTLVDLINMVQQGE